MLFRNGLNALATLACGLVRGGFVDERVELFGEFVGGRNISVWACWLICDGFVDDIMGSFGEFVDGINISVWAC